MCKMKYLVDGQFTMAYSKMRIDNSSKFDIFPIFHFVLNIVSLNLNEQLQLQIQHTLNVN